MVKITGGDGPNQFIYLCQIRSGQAPVITLTPPGPEINVVHNRNTVVNCVTLLGPFIISINKNGSFIMQKLIFSPIYDPL